MRIPLPEYPRPQLRRDSYLCLNGEWNLRFLSDGDKAEDYRILVPYSPESEISGVNRTLQQYETMLYSTHVDFPDVDLEKSRLLLHFGAVDYRAVVFIDKKQVLDHVGDIFLSPWSWIRARLTLMSACRILEIQRRSQEESRAQSPAGYGTPRQVESGRRCGWRRSPEHI